MNRYRHVTIDGYEKVVRCINSTVGFKAWIAVHNSFRGPALGGCRLWDYDSDADALADALRLSRAMTYKNALARLPLGGGKSVVKASPSSINRDALFEAVGLFVNYLKGQYIIAEDVNSTLRDMEIIKRKTIHVATVGASGNPSPFTAYGVYCAIKASVRHKLNRDRLGGLRVAIQGVGETGGRLASQLYNAGCDLIVTDINQTNLDQLARFAKFTTVEPEKIYDVPCDIFSPCALGGILNQHTIPRLACAIIAGSANNQLQDKEDGKLLQDRGILYAPDYAANAGGVINISCEIG